MAQNPLQQFFRQPKVYVSLPSKGAYNKLGSIQGDATNMPVYGMTGMDEILMKTPDALMTGESTVRVIQSCCPYIKDAWELASIDTDLVFTAIRIATFGNTMGITTTCPNCSADNEYDVDLTKYVDYFANFTFNNKIESGQLTVKIRPLTYKESSEFAIRNFQMRQTLQQAIDLPEEDQQKNQLMAKVFQDLAVLQNDIFSASIDSVDTPTATVDDKTFIKEWIENCEKTIFDDLKQKFEDMRLAIAMPEQTVTCTSCSHEFPVTVGLDQSNFFVKA
jgi:hypothetical protein